MSFSVCSLLLPLTTTKDKIYYWPPPHENVQIVLKAKFQETDYNGPYATLLHISQVTAIMPPAMGLPLRVQYRRLFPQPDQRGASRNIEVRKRDTIPLARDGYARKVHCVVTNFGPFLCVVSLLRTNYLFTSRAVCVYWGGNLQTLIVTQ